MMTSYQDFHELIRAIDTASRQREIDGEVRSMESAARREAVRQLRSAAKSRLSAIRDELGGLKSQRDFLRRRIRDEMRAQLLNLNADVERLRRQVQDTIQGLKNGAGRLAASQQQQTAAFRADLGRQIAERRRDTQRLLTQLGDRRAERAAQTKARLSAGMRDLRAATADTLSAHRAERARLSATWAAVRHHRSLRSAPRLPLTLSDPRQAARAVERLLSADRPNAEHAPPEAAEERPASPSSETKRRS